MFEFFQNGSNEELWYILEQINNLFNNYVEFDSYIESISESLWPNGFSHKKDEFQDEHYLGNVRNSDHGRLIEKLPRVLDPKDISIQRGYSEEEILIWQRIISFLGELDIRLRHDLEFTSNYLYLVRSYLNEVAEIAVTNDGSNEEDVIEIRNLIQVWLDYYTRSNHLTAHGLLYIHQTIHQISLLLELYQPYGYVEVPTQRHLFELGLKRLRMNDLQYAKVLFSISNTFSRYFIHPFYQIASLFLYNSSTIITWIKNPKYDNLVRRELYEGVQYAEYAYPDKRGTRNGIQATVLSPFKITYSKYNCGGINGEFELQDEFKGFVGVKNIGTHNQEIIIGFSGTECLTNWVTDFSQYFGNLPLPYIEALGLVDSVWRSTRNKKSYINPLIKVYGHSLGGGLMQFAVSNCDIDRIIGYGYNSAGISNQNVINIINFDRRIYHLYKPKDVIFKIPGTHQLGYSISCKETGSICTAHFLDSIKNEIQKYGYDHYVELK